MSLGCARCGDCCDPVHLSADMVVRSNYWREVAEDVWAGIPAEPDSDAGFVVDHLTAIGDANDGGTNYRCDFYDADARACTAHDQRPEMCSGFPFYNDVIPTGARLDVTADGPSCSYWLDVPPSMRPEGVRPLIPLEVLR